MILEAAHSLHRLCPARLSQKEDGGEPQSIQELIEALEDTIEAMLQEVKRLRQELRGCYPAETSRSTYFPP